MADAALLTVKSIHVLAAMLWAGFGVYESFVHVPALKRLAAPERLQHMVASVAKTSPIYAVLALVTLLSGFELARLVLGTANPGEWFTGSDPRGPLIGTGLILALGALVLGILHAPQLKRLRALQKRTFAADVSAEANRTYRRLVMLGHTGTLLILVTAFLMIASNLGGF